MFRIGQPLATEGTRRRYVLPAVVVAHTTYTTGWLWKRRWPSLKLRFTNEALDELRGILIRDLARRADRAVSFPDNCIESGFHKTTNRDQFVVGEDVEVLFSTASFFDQDFNRSEPFRWDEVRKRHLKAA